MKSHPKLTQQQKKIDTDLWIILAVTFAVLSIYFVFNAQLNAFLSNNAITVLSRVLLAACLQFGLAGLGITVVSVLRKESFLSHGLQKNGLIPSSLLCLACCLPEFLFLLFTGEITSYLPFQSVHTTREVLNSPFPVNVLGLMTTAAAWGFFEGFNYVFICDRINERYPSANRWWSWGAFSCAVMCILIHGVIGVTPAAIIEMFCTMALIYGMLIVRERTGNAWGCVAVFVLFWNAV